MHETTGRSTPAPTRRRPRRPTRSRWRWSSACSWASALSVGATTVAPAGADTPCACSLWSDSTTPGVVDSGDANAVELGVQFSSASAGYISGVRFYKASANTGIHIGSLWTADGTLLAQATFSNESASGWQQVTFSQPVAIAANTTYVAGYHTNTGHYSADHGYFSGGSYTNGPLTAPGNATNPNGVFAYSPTPTFPTGTFNGDNYWVDVVYSPTAPPPPAPAASLWGPNATPTVVDSGDTNAVELGVQFSSAGAGFINGVRFYKASANTGTHIGSLWTADGTLLAQATFSNETASGWQQVTFSQPVAITANTIYVAGYHTDTGHYSGRSRLLHQQLVRRPTAERAGWGPGHPQRRLRLQPDPRLPHRHLQRQQLLGRRRLLLGPGAGEPDRVRAPEPGAPGSGRAAAGHRELQRRQLDRRDLQGGLVQLQPGQSDRVARRRGQRRRPGTGLGHRQPGRPDRFDFAQRRRSHGLRVRRSVAGAGQSRRNSPAGRPPPG